MEKLLNCNQVADLLAVSPKTVFGWIYRGVSIPHIRIEGTVRFREKALQEWLIERERARKKRNFEL